MKKRLITLAVAAAVAVPLAAQAAAGDVDVTGFADIIYTQTDEAADVTGGDNPNEKKFTADAEVDFIASPVDGVTARIDIDLDLATNGGTSVGGDSGRIEQAFFAWNINQGPLTLLGGVFNNPMGQDEEDAPNINFTNHSAVFNVLDNQTALDGNNITGVALAAGAGMFTGTVAFLNDIQQVSEENSLAIILTAMPMPDMEFEFGYVSQDSDNGDFSKNLTTNPIGAGDVWDINGEWSNIAGSGAAVGFDYLSASTVIDKAYNVWAGYEFGGGFVIRGRYEEVAADLSNGGATVDDTTAFSLYGAWQARSNLLIALEYRAVDADSSTAAADVGSRTFDIVNGLVDGDLVTLEFIATLP